LGKELTIIYYTDGSVKDSIGNLVREYIKKADLPIISVSQKPCDFGENVCVGDIGRSYLSIQKQVLAGAKAAKTKCVALAEHDTLYPDGYFDWIPQNDRVFYYNENRVFVVAKKGPQYGLYIPYKDSHPNADQLICNRDLLINATERRIEMLEAGGPRPVGWGEPGFCDEYPDEQWEWRWNTPASIDILHNDNFTYRVGTYVNTGYDLEEWGKWEKILPTV
jgi:hypothetical protein